MLVMDNLNTHGIAVALRGIPTRRSPRTRPAPRDPSHPQARVLAGIAEIELSALTRQCPGRRISDLDVLNSELSAWQAATNADQRQVDWQFTTEDARVKLRHLYPN